jgi:organic hydroperoxide reductase OsmC/OhrA
MEARVTGSIVRNEEGRLRIGGIRVELVPQVVPEAKQRIGRCLEVFEDFCMVTQSLRQGIDIAVEVTVEDPASAT